MLNKFFAGPPSFSVCHLHFPSAWGRVLLHQLLLHRPGQTEGRNDHRRWVWGLLFFATTGKQNHVSVYSKIEQFTKLFNMYKSCIGIFYVHIHCRETWFWLLSLTNGILSCTNCSVAHCCPPVTAKGSYRPPFVCWHFLQSWKQIQLSEGWQQNIDIWGAVCHVE